MLGGSGKNRHVGHRLMFPLERWLAEVDGMLAQSCDRTTGGAAFRLGRWCEPRPRRGTRTLGAEAVVRIGRTDR